MSPEEEAQFSVYVNARRDRVRRTAYLLCGDWHRADDLTQIAFVKLYGAWADIRDYAALDAFVRTGAGSPTLAERKKKLPEFQSKNRRPIDKAFIHSIFDRDHPGAADEKVINAFADAVTALDSSVPTGTYVDMCSKLPVVNPEKITVPTLIMRGQWDGIASIEDLLKFYAKLPNPDKQFTVMPGISHASFQQKNYMLVYHILASFFAQPAPLYRG